MTRYEPFEQKVGKTQLRSSSDGLKRRLLRKSGGLRHPLPSRKSNLPGQKREGRWCAVAGEPRTMTGDESRNLKVGTRVCFDGEQADRGTVTATHARYVTI